MNGLAAALPDVRCVGGAAARCLLHYLELQPVVVLGLGADLSRCNLTIVQCGEILDSARDGGLATYFCLNGALSIHLGHCLVHRRGLVHEHHLVGRSG